MVLYDVVQILIWLAIKNMQFTPPLYALTLLIDKIKQYYNQWVSNELCYVRYYYQFLGWLFIHLQMTVIAKGSA